MDLILDYEEFKIYYDDKRDKYFAIEHNELYNVVPTLKIVYDVVDDISYEMEIGWADYTGEQITQDNIIFWGFDLC